MATWSVNVFKQYKDYDFEGKEEAELLGDTSVDKPISKFFGLHVTYDNNVKERVKYQMKDYDYIKSKLTGNN